MGNSICGFLQANDKGMTTVPYCECERGEQCPVQWDQFDGRSISQAKSDQYKYCGMAPKLSVCSSKDEVAYTSVQMYQGDRKVLIKDDLHCICPFGSSYQDVKFEFKEEGIHEIVEVTYFCLPLKECNVSETCKDITEKPGEYIVNPKCVCGGDRVCPSVSHQNSHTTRFGDTLLHRVECQRPHGNDGRRGDTDQMLHRLRNSLIQNNLKQLELDVLRQNKRAKGYRETRWGPAIGMFGGW